MISFRFLTISALSALVYILLTPGRQAVAQQRPGIRAQVIAPDGCSISDPVDTEDMFSFIRTEIQALSFARAGERASFRPAPAGVSGPSGAPNFLGLREERIDNTCASFILSPYTGSKIEGVKTVADYLVSAYDELAKQSDEMLGIKMRGGFSTGQSALIDLTKWNARRQEILKNMTDAVNLSLLLLIRKGGEGESSQIILGQEERHSLLTYLDSLFPVTGAIGNSVDFTKQAALIRSFLSNGQ